MVHEELALRRSRARSMGEPVEEEGSIRKVEISEPEFAKKVSGIICVCCFCPILNQTKRTTGSSAGGVPPEELLRQSCLCCAELLLRCGAQSHYAAVLIAARETRRYPSANHTHTHFNYCPFNPHLFIFQHTHSDLIRFDLMIFLRTLAPFSFSQYLFYTILSYYLFNSHRLQQQQQLSNSVKPTMYLRHYDDDHDHDVLSFFSSTHKKHLHKMAAIVFCDMAEV